MPGGISGRCSALSVRASGGGVAARCAVRRPSALVIGSVAPDLWYLLPFIDRAQTHSLSGVLAFCLPAGLLLYLLFHFVLSEPLIALLSPRLRHLLAAHCRLASAARCCYATAGVPTHLLAWDGLTHANTPRPGVNWVQHAEYGGGHGDPHADLAQAAVGSGAAAEPLGYRRASAPSLRSPVWDSCGRSARRRFRRPSTSSRCAIC